MEINKHLVEDGKAPGAACSPAMETVRPIEREADDKTG